MTQTEPPPVNPDGSARRTPYYATQKLAMDAKAMGWNIRCNVCGCYGAAWLPNARPGWGALALCPEHKADLMSLAVRHWTETRPYFRIAYEQDPNAWPSQVQPVDDGRAKTVAEQLRTLTQAVHLRVYEAYGDYDPQSVNHDSGCAVYDPDGRGSNPCDCGMDALKDALDRAEAFIRANRLL